MDDSTTSPIRHPTQPEPVPSPLRFQGRWVLAAVLLLEILALAGAFALFRKYGEQVLGHALAVLLVPAVLLTGLGLFLCAWRSSIRPRSLLGWGLLLAHLGSFVAGATVLAASIQMKRRDFPAFVRSELGLALQGTAAPASEDPAPAADALQVQAGAAQETRGEAVAIEVPDSEPGRGDSLLARGPQGWCVVVRRDSGSEAVVRTLVAEGRRVPLTYPDSGEAWAASGEVTLLQCHHKPVAALTHLGLCPRRTEVGSEPEGFGCEEPVVPHVLLVNLRTGSRRLLGSEVGIAQALDSAQQWFKGEACAI